MSDAAVPRAASRAMQRLGRGVAALTGWRRWALAAALGALAVGAFPPIGALPLFVVAFTGLVWLIDGARRLRSAVAVGWWFGLGYFAAGLYWVTIAFFTDPLRYGWMAPFALAGLSAGLALFPATATALTWTAVRRGWVGAGAGRVVALAVAWTALEWVRGHALTGFPWNLAGSVLWISDAAIQGAAVVGVYGLSLIVVAVVAMPATLGDMAPSRWRGAVATGAAVVALAALWGAGAVRLLVAGPADATVPGVALRLIQPNISQRNKWQAEMRAAHFALQLAMTHGAETLRAAPPPAAPAHAPSPAGQAPGKSAPTVFAIWAETATPYVLDRDPGARAAIAAVVPPGGLVITGVVRTTAQGVKPFRIWNSIEAVDGTGRIVGAYDKFHLVPFGEYLPLRRYFSPFLNIAKLTHGRIDFSPGPGPRTLRLPGLPPVSPLICYEAIFPGAVTDPGDRPAWLLNVTNDGWFGLSSGPYQHFQSARLRAVEEGLPLVRVANTGISGVVDAHGRIVASLDLGRQGVVESPLPMPLSGPTPYSRFGDWGLLALLVAGAALARVLRRPRPGAARGSA